MKAAIDDFHKTNPTIAIEPVYGSSGDFYSQISNGAPFDLFLSADMEYPRKLANAQLADYKSLFIYSVGHLVLWVPKASPIEVDKRQVGALMLDSVHKIAIANPQHAPYGRAAEGFLKNQGIYEKVQPKLVLGENIAQTLQFVESGSAEVGIVALSLAMSPAVRAQGRYWLIPDEDYPPMEQGGIVMTKASDPRATHIFAAYLLTPRAREVLSQYGFSMPHE